MEIDTTGWSGDGSFTQTLIETLTALDEIALLRVEDAPASRAEAGYNFISNEVYVAFKEQRRLEPIRRFKLLPGHRVVAEKAMTIEALGTRLERVEGVGAPDYGDAGMLQYLRTERIVAPYQTKGMKVVELVRIYEVSKPTTFTPGAGSRQF